MRYQIVDLLRGVEGEFLTAGVIAEETDFLSDHKTEGRVRRAITLLIEEGYPIMSSRRGFCYTSDVNEHLKFIENLQKRIRGMERKIKDISVNIEKWGTPADIDKKNKMIEDYGELNEEAKEKEGLGRAES